MKFKIDEDLPADIAVKLRAQGHDALTVFEQHLTGTPDGRLWQLIQSETRLLITADKGFADVRTHAPGRHAGIILLRLPRESRAGYLSLFDLFLERGRLEDAAGAIVVVSPASIRVHRAQP